MSKWIVRKRNEELYFCGFGYRNAKCWKEDPTGAHDYRSREAAERAAKALKGEAVEVSPPTSRYPAEFQGRTVYVTCPED